MNNISPLGQKLKEHRRQRGLSQLELAALAESTPRYISFIETGRSRPGQDVLLRIAKSLNLTLRDSNGLLMAAGLSPAFVEPDINDEQMAPVRQIIKEVLSKHDPYPAWVIGPGLQFLDSNAAAERVIPGIVGTDPRDLIHVWCLPNKTVPEATRVNTIFQLRNGLRHEMHYYPHPILSELIAIVDNYAKNLKPPSLAPESPVMFSEIAVAGEQVNTLATVMRFDKVVNVTMSEIRIELVFPADKEGERIFKKLAS